MAIIINPTSGYIGKQKNIVTCGLTCKIVVHRFQIHYAASRAHAEQSLMEWHESEMGKWVMQRTVDTIKWHSQMDAMQFNMQYAIVARLKSVDYTFWTLKWGNDVDSTGIFNV